MPLPKNAKNDQYQRLERRQRVAALYVEGESQVAIAAAVGVTQGTISNDLAAIRKQWLASTVQDFGERQAMELAKLDHLEAEAWAAYERSCIKATAMDIQMDDGRVMTLCAIDPSKRPGDPRFLERVAKCVELRCKITGVIGADTNVQQTVSVDINTIPAEVSRATHKTTGARLLEMVNPDDAKPVEVKPLPIGLKERPPAERPLADWTDAELLERILRGKPASNGHVSGNGICCHQ